MLINMRNGLMAGGRLPYDAEVEYLGFSGVQYIDTAFVATGGCVMECSYYVESDLTGGEANVLVGSHNPEGNPSNEYNRNELKVLYPYRVGFNKCNRFNYFYVNNLSGAYHTFYFDNRGTRRLGKIDGVVIVDENTSMLLNPVSPILIGGSGYFSATPALIPALPSGKVAWVKLWNANGDPVRDLIPVRFTNEQGVSEGAMYDRVAKKLFRIQGTGAFLTGSDKSAANGGGV